MPRGRDSEGSKAPLGPRVGLTARIDCPAFVRSRKDAPGVEPCDNLMIGDCVESGDNVLPCLWGIFAGF
jgi:hypothetical protein